MTISAVSVGLDFDSQYIDRSFFNTIQDLDTYDYLVVNPTSIQGLSSPPFSARKMSSVCDKFRQQAYTYLTNGGKVVCFLQPMQVLHDLTNYDWLMAIEDKNHRQFIQPLYGKRCHVTEAAGPWRQYLEYPALEFHSHWLGNHPATELLAYSDANKYIAVKLSVGEGYIIFVPPICNQNHAQIFVRTLRRDAQQPPVERPVIAPPWISEYELTKEAECNEEVNLLNIKIKDLILDRDTKAQYLLYLSSLTDLLWGTGIQVLETAVQRAFQELGFDVQKQGDVDLTLSCDLGKAYVEVEGTEKMVRVRKCEQLLRYILNHRSQSGEHIKGILVGNAFRLRNPKDRPPLEEQFSLQTKEFARLNKVTIIPAVVLYNLVDSVHSSRLKQKEAQELIFGTAGLLGV